MKKFAYVFALRDDQLQWSWETPTSLHKRGATIDDCKTICDFIINSNLGDFIELTTGEMIFRTE